MATCVTSSEWASNTARGRVCFADFLTSHRVTTVSKDAISRGEEWDGVSQQLKALRCSVSVKWCVAAPVRMSQHLRREGEEKREI